MTTNSTIGSRNRTFHLPPFGDGSEPYGVWLALEAMLKNCRFAPYRGSNWAELDKHPLEPGAPFTPVDPIFKFAVNPTRAYEKLPLTKDDLEIVLSARSDFLKKYEVLETWAIDSVPDEWPCPPQKLEAFQSPRGIDFVLAVRVVGRRDVLSEQGLDEHKVLCRKFFSVTEKVDTSDFPFEWVDWSTTKQPEGGLWYIEWKVDFDEDDAFLKPVDEVLVVKANKRADTVLGPMEENDTGKRMAQRMFASEVLTEIYWQVICWLVDAKRMPDGEATGTLAAEVLSKLSEVTGEQASEISKWDKLGAEGRVKLRNWVADYLSLVN